MILPLPELLLSCLPDDDDVRSALLEFQKLAHQLEPALKSKLIFRSDVPVEFPSVLASWLFSTLQRVRITCWGVITSINSTNEIIFVLATRSILESTALLAYVEDNLKQTYQGDISREAMTELAIRMKFCTRTPEDFGYTEPEANRTKATNILTAIKRLDRVLEGNLKFHGSNTATAWYERLSEYCHPNMLGNSIGSKLDYADGVENFDLEPSFTEGTLEEFGYYLRFLMLFFCMLYNRCWEQMYDAAEELPYWQPDTDPRIYPPNSYPLE